MDEERSEGELVHRAMIGDHAALNLLLNHSYRPLCQRIARQIPTDLHRIVDAEDVMQEAHLEAFRHIGGFQSRGAGSFDHWVASIAASRLRNAIKKHRAAKRGHAQAASATSTRQPPALALLETVAGPSAAPAWSTLRVEDIEALRAALMQLSQDQRLAVWLVHGEGCAVRVAADCMQRTERAIHGLCRRGLQRLRGLLGENRPGSP